MAEAPHHVRLPCTQMALAIILRIVGERNGERGKGRENVRFTMIRMVPQLPFRPRGVAD